jgi:Flp pilus assembly protein TadG
VEFALVAPLLFTLVFGIIDFGWLFGQHLDTRHGAREASRLAAVNFNPNGSGGAAQTNDLVLATCQRMDLASDSTVQLSLVEPGNATRGAFATVTVRTEVEQLTGFFAPILDGITLESTIESRLEQDATWSPDEGAISCP